MISIIRYKQLLSDALLDIITALELIITLNKLLLQPHKESLDRGDVYFSSLSFPPLTPST